MTSNVIFTVAIVTSMFGVYLVAANAYGWMADRFGKRRCDVSA